MDERHRSAARGRRLWIAGLAAVAAVHSWGIGLLLEPVPWVEKSEHHDAIVMIQRIEMFDNPWRWLVSDWPLLNGFYRPLPSLSYELDLRLYGHNLQPYGITNLLVGLGCSLLLVWLVWGLFRDRGAAIGCGVLFSAWQSGLSLLVPFDTLGTFAGLACLGWGVMFGRGRIWTWLSLAGVSFFALRELGLVVAFADVSSQTFAFRSTGWSPGRTATMMTLFGLLSAASYCRFERERKARWAALSAVGLLLAFGSYEQCVVIAPVLLACAVALWLQGVRVRWWWQAVPWGMTLAYVGLHALLLQADTNYRMASARGPKGGVRDTVLWLFPASREASILWSQLELGPDLWLIAKPWALLGTVLGNAVAYLQLHRRWLPLVFGLVVSTGAYAPLAFQHPLTHYYHLPLAIRTVFVVWLLLAGRDLLLSAFGRRTTPALQEPAPALR